MSYSCCPWGEGGWGIEPAPVEVDSVLLSAASGGSAAMMRLPSVEDRLSRRLAEGHHRHVAAECELVRLDPQRLARFDRRDRDRKSVVSGKRVAVRVDLGGRRIIKKKKITVYKLKKQCIQ